MQVHDTPIRVGIEHGQLVVEALTEEGFSQAVRVGIGDDIRELAAGERCAFALA